MIRLALRYPIVTALAVLGVVFSLCLLDGWRGGEVGFSRAPARGPEAQSILNAAFPPKDPATRFEPEPAPDFTLTDQDGKLVALRAFGGKVVLINFMSTECRNMCPQTTRELKGLQERFAPQMGKEIFILSITVDPEHDTQQVLKAYAQKNGVDVRSWRFLTGSDKELAKVRERYNVRAEPIVDEKGEPDIGHTASTFVVDPEGWVRAKLQPGAITLLGQAVVERVLAMLDG